MSRGRHGFSEETFLEPLGRGRHDFGSNDGIGGYMVASPRRIDVLGSLARHGRAGPHPHQPEATPNNKRVG
jgi:hypothetical protein